MLIGIDHVQLAMPAGGEDRAEAFYAGLLGLTRVPKPEPLAARGGCWFQGPGVEVHLGVEDPFAPARKTHPAFRVRGYDALLSALRASGTEVRPATALPGVRRAHVDDPFGNRLELIAAEP